MNERRRLELRPWIRRLPAPAIYAVFVVLSPLVVVAHVVAGMWDRLRKALERIVGRCDRDHGFDCACTSGYEARSALAAIPPRSDR